MNGGKAVPRENGENMRCVLTTHPDWVPWEGHERINFPPQKNLAKVFGASLGELLGNFAYDSIDRWISFDVAELRRRGYEVDFQDRGCDNNQSLCDQNDHKDFSDRQTGAGS